MGEKKSGLNTSRFLRAQTPCLNSRESTRNLENYPILDGRQNSKPEFLGLECAQESDNLNCNYSRILDRSRRVIFEISWEVANKVGGIYTVISTKARHAMKLANSYYFVGPYFRGRNNGDFFEEELPEEFKEVNLILNQKGIGLHFGKWKTVGASVLLIDFTDLMRGKNEIKTKLWEEYKVDSLFAGMDFEEPMIFGYAAGMLLDEFSKCAKNAEIIGQFHEWLTGAGILYLKKRNPRVASVFTTHATVLERAMADSREEFCEWMKADEEAIKKKVQAKHTLEKQSALNADVFTSVSEKSGNACTLILGRKPDVFTINGMDLKQKVEGNEIMKNYRAVRAQLEGIIASHFFPHYEFDVKNAFLCFLSGRKEIHSKGIDVFFEALVEMNREFKNKDARTIVAFIIVPAEHSNPKEELVKRVREMQCLSGKFEKIKEHFIAEKKQGNPEITTHDGADSYISSILLQGGLDNESSDKVKIIFCPVYLHANDGFWNMEYTDFIQGFDLGVFPSSYEPWGYTPAECAALGVPAITTDSAGFGLYVKKHGARNQKGIFVLDREGKSDEEFTKILKEKICEIEGYSEKEMLDQRIEAAKFMKKLSWKELIKNYEIAYKLAIEKKEMKPF